ncbi:MAG TPA: prolyl oligopeptidase family serine peptidase [Candidatus Acidoferrum sp.]|jgi:dipeptidyl aminopeptidase/acylaminoacyl peptidase
MNSTDDHSSLPSGEIRAQRGLRNARRTATRGIIAILLTVAFVFVVAPRFAAQTPSEPPAAAQPQSATQQATPAPVAQPPAQTAPPARTIQLDDMTKITSVSDPQISPDGKAIAFVRSRVNLEQDRADRDLLVIDIASGAPRALTHDRKGVGSPRWSPEGDRLAFEAVDTSAKDPKLQLFVLPMTGGEAHRLTDVPDGIEQFAWSPNGQDIAFVTSDEPENKKEIEKHNDAFEVGDNDYLATGPTTPSHLWIVGAEGGKPRRLTSGPWSLAKSAPPSSPASPINWSPDGKSILFTRQEHPQFGDADQTTLQVLDVASGATRRVTTREKFESFGLFSPDGTKIAYWYPRESDPNNQNEIVVTPTPAVGGAPTDGAVATSAIDHNMSRVIWMPDSNSILVGGHDATQTSMWLQPLGASNANANAAAPKKLNLGDVSPSWAFWVDAFVGRKGEIAFTGSSPTQPSELYYMASANDSPRRLTNFNANIAALKLGEAEKFEWKGPDNFAEDGVLIYPPDYDKDKKYPLVLYIHGGPTASSITAFSFFAQYLASRGYIIFSPNYRGSDNLGNAYQRAIFNDAGDGPGRDVIAGIDAIKKLNIIDENQIAVSGWSYGGYMTSWLIGHYNFWKVAVAGAPVTDEYDEYNLSDGNVSGRYSFKGSPYVGDNLKDYRAQSPITYWANIKTPTLLLHDTGDARVTITQSYSLFHALKDNGVEVKFFAYPVGGHFPGDPVRQMDVYRRWADWLDQHLK